MTLEDSKLVRSLFYQEAAEIKKILETCDRHTIVFIDEYARATSHLNGLALFKTLTEFLTSEDLFRGMRGSKKASLPTSVISTNLKELFT